VAEPSVAGAAASQPGDLRRGASMLLLAATLVLMALNLRAAVASIGPVLRDMQLELGMSDTVAGVLTTLPVVCFGAFGLLAGRLGRRVGMETALVTALLLMTVGPAVRAFAPNTGLLLLTSLLPLLGIAIGNVLAPVAVKAWFPRDVGRMTGWYSMAIAAGTGLAAALTVPLADAFGGWRAGIGLWAIPAGLALVPWAMVVRQRRAAFADGPVVPAGPSPEIAGVPAAAPAAGDASNTAEETPRVAVHRQPKAWALAAFFGFQTIEAYTALGWLPSILQDAGLSPQRAGTYLAIAMALGAPIALLLPRWAARAPDQRPWVVALVLAAAGAYLGLVFAPATLSLLWVVLLGIGLGAFPLALVLIGLRSATPAGTVALSSLTQGAGYLFAAMGPVAVGALHDLTGGWTLPLSVLLVFLVPKTIAGWYAAKPGTVD
jgi:MFS transporter, CP family, cyanate transporter